MSEDMAPHQSEKHIRPHYDFMRNPPLLFLMAVIAFACSNTDRKLSIDDLAEQGEKLDATAAKLEGKWIGFYQELDPSFDTVFYGKYEDKLEYLLSGRVTDSSLVKEITLRDTFDIKPVSLEFIPSDTSAWDGMAKITFARDTTVQLPFTLNVPSNLTNELIAIEFGIMDDSVVNELWYQYELASIVSYDDAFSTGSFVLDIQQISDDSLRFSLPGGYGKMILGRSDRNQMNRP